MIVTILEEVETDLDSIFTYYQVQQPGSGLKFLDDFRSTLDRVLQFPAAWAPIHTKYRRCQFKRFPYGIVYHLSDDLSHLIVTTVIHLNRRPNSWRRI